MSKYVLLGIIQSHNLRAMTIHHLQIQCHQGCQGKWPPMRRPLRIPQGVAPLWGSLPSHPQFRKPVHLPLTASVLPPCHSGWSEHGTPQLLLLNIHVLSRVQAVDRAQPQCKVNLGPMGPLILAQSFKDRNPSTIPDRNPSTIHGITPPQISMGCHTYRNVLSIGMILRDNRGVLIPGTRELLLC
jgi:hypothetical protein